MPRDVIDGALIDAKDNDDKWFEAKVLETKGRKKGRDRFFARVHYQVLSCFPI